MAGEIDYDAIVDQVERKSPLTEFSRMQNIMRDYQQGNIEMEDLASELKNKDQVVAHLLAINTLAANTADAIGKDVEGQDIARFDMKDIRGEQEEGLVAAVWETLDNQDPKVRQLAAETLGTIGRYDSTRVTVEKLSEFRSRESDPRVREALNKSIDTINRPFGSDE